MLNTTSGNARNQIEMACLQVSDELVRALSSELVLEAIIYPVVDMHLTRTLYPLSFQLDESGGGLQTMRTFVEHSVTI